VGDALLQVGVLLSAFGLQAAKFRPDADGTGAVHGLYSSIATTSTPLADLDR
jgi:hypothetical protein